MEASKKEQEYGWVWVVIIVIIIIAAAVSTNSNEASSNDYSGSGSNYNSTSDYSEDISDEEEPATFNGYECTSDCSGHEAGYEWAEENGITQDDVDGYSGNSSSFEEGMQSYVDEN